MGSFGSNMVNQVNELTLQIKELKNQLKVSKEQISCGEGGCQWNFDTSCTCKQINIQNRTLKCLSFIQYEDQI